MYCPKPVFFLCLLFVFIQPHELVAQGSSFTADFEQKRDKGIADLKNYKEADTARVNALVRLFGAAIFLKQRKELYPYCQEAMSISRRIGYMRGMAHCYMFMGLFNKSSLNSSVAHTYFDSVITTVGNSSDPKLIEIKATANSLKGRLFYEQENYYAALGYFFESLKYYGNKPGVYSISQYIYICNIYVTLNNLEKAEEYAKKNIALNGKDPDNLQLATIYLCLTNIYLEKREFQQASVALDKIALYFPDSTEVILSFGYYEKRGRISLAQEKYAEALSYYNLGYKYAQMSGHPSNLTYALNMMATLSLKLGDMPAAKKYATANLELANKGTIKTVKVDALLTLSQYYEKTGNTAKALSLTREAVTLKDSLVSETNIKQINTLATIYETDKRRQEILLLQSEKGITAVAVKQKSILNRIFVATIIGLLFFGWLAYRNVKNEKKIAGQQRKIQAQRISELEKDKQLLTVDAMLKGQEEERSRIAKDLHDGLGGMLSGVKLSFINMKEKIIFTQENLNNFEKSVGMLDSTIGELRKVAHNLMPEVLVKFGLEEALKDFCGSIQATTGISIVYQQFGDERKLNNQAEVNIYRIIQELVHNAVKHAGASQIIVQLTKNHVKTGVTVEDDGKGFDTRILDTKKGAGFSNIRYRVLYFKGTLDIMSEPENGTSVSIELMA